VPGRLRRTVAAIVARLLPREFRQRYGEELIDTFTSASTAARRQGGRAGEARFVVREIVAFVALVLALHRSSSREDLRWALRRAVRQPRATTTLVLTLAASIAAVTTAFGLAESILWRPLPFADAGRLVFVWEHRGDAATGPMRVTSARYVDWRDHPGPFGALAIFGAAGFTLESDDGATAIRGLRVSANYFDTLGVQPLLGRGLSTGDDVPGQHQVIVLSHELWQGRFGGRPEIVGEAVRLSGTPYTVVGVMPPLLFPGWPVNPATVTVDRAAHQFWVPVPRTPAFSTNAMAHVFGVVARLAPGVDTESARRQLEAAVPANGADPHAATLQPLREQFVADARLPLLLLLAATAALLVIACANVAAVQIAGFESRRTELAMRTALGASTPRLARQLMLEVLVNSLIAGSLGLATAQFALSAIPALLPPHVPFMTPPGVNPLVALFGMASAFASGIALAMWPIAAVVSGRVASRGVMVGERRGLYRGLVVMQIATAMSMVTAAALLVQSLRTVTARDPGFAIEDVLVSDVGLPGAAYATAATVVQFERRLRAELAARPGIGQAALAYDHPLESNWSNSYTLVGAAGRLDDESTRQAELRIVSPSYFDALDVELLSGRGFGEHEDVNARGVAVVNEALATSVSGPLIGRTIRLTPPRATWGERVPDEFEIVGIVENERFRGLEAASEPALYISTLQFPQTMFALLTRAERGATGVPTTVRSALRDLERQATATPARTLASLADEQMTTRRVTTDVIGGLSAVSLGLASLGVYGLLAVGVASRRREIGVRLAVGATPSSIGGQIFRESLATAGLGIAVGALVAAVTGRVLESMLVDITARDPATFVAVSVTLLVIALTAALVPALRAARTDPAITLRPQ
jgi:putative ABC transport system permease protein